MVFSYLNGGQLREGPALSAVSRRYCCIDMGVRTTHACAYRGHVLKYYKGEHVAMKQTIDGMMIVTITACFSTVVYSREEQEYMAAAVQVEVYSVCCHPIRCDHNVLTCLTPPPLPSPAAYLPAMHAISVWGGGGG